MNGVGSEYYNRMKAQTAVRSLIRSLRGLGYEEAKAVEVVEDILEKARLHGLKTDCLWDALDRVAPIQGSK
jgi:Holliday junction resolvasome RuvABC DNA-binding subunit